MKQKTKLKTPRPELSVIGWMESVALPQIDLRGIKAKIDTGARTSALHALYIEPFDNDGEEWVRFQVQLSEDAPGQWVETPLHDQRHIKNTSGIPEERYVIRTELEIAGKTWPIAVSLTDRSNMRFPMIVGRSALKNRNIAVHTRRAYLTTGKAGNA
ncbi:ATP-dependent zinc protease family protein [Actibacterium lipolyticum]|uniref:Retropepsin-like aspartic endopeptidase domain-containing protein n=1 Tax=Actibacterium lipolyticum TaxID=1524263 RepID=A0A238KG22_9RHOB|nr:ATP-dependent zinc protease [Actibacterium lipolyticum]SMX41464.1 hypothetical protein COL8621_01760 [Actibacterium lipolyticum]